jgi:malate synthase
MDIDAKRARDARHVEVEPPVHESEAFEDVLSPDALAFLKELDGRFEPRRLELLAARMQRRSELASGAMLEFLAETREIREGEWSVGQPRADYLDRRVEITGPCDRKTMINALNSGARGFMVDFEDATSPTWSNLLAGQRNVRDAVFADIAFTSADGRRYELGPEPATLLMRPRGLHLPERHLLIDGRPMSGALVDFGLFVFHCGRELAQSGKGCYVYLPKLEHHLEARLWDEIFTFCEDALRMARGNIRATVLIETYPAAFQMQEILWELRDHMYGLNAGRWDYIFSVIKSFRERPEFLLPERGQVTMKVPFMRAYTEALVKVCHQRGTFAMGGMSALIPSRTNSDANERAIRGVQADKRREAEDGFDGTWVAHPDTVEVAAAEFDRVLGERSNQISRQRDDVKPDAGRLLDVVATGGTITEDGLRNNVSVGFQYISYWLQGRGAAANNNQIEDAATAEICRMQIWQWIHHSAKLVDGRTVTRALVCEILDQEMARIEEQVGREIWVQSFPQESRLHFEAAALSEPPPEFLTLDAYEDLERTR